MDPLAAPHGGLIARRWGPCYASSTPMVRLLWGSASSRSSPRGSGTALSGSEDKFLPASVRLAQPGDNLPVDSFPGQRMGSLS